MDMLPRLDKMLNKGECSLNLRVACISGGGQPLSADSEGFSDAGSILTRVSLLFTPTSGRFMQ